MLFIVAAADADAVVVVDVGLGLFVGCFCFGFCFSFRNTFKPYSRCQRHRRHCRRQHAFLAVCAQEIQNPIGKHTCRQVLNTHTHTHNSNVTAFKHSVRACIIYVLYISKNTNNNKNIYTIYNLIFDTSEHTPYYINTYLYVPNCRTGHNDALLA